MSWIAPPSPSIAQSAFCDIADQIAKQPSSEEVAITATVSRSCLKRTGLKTAHSTALRWPTSDKMGENGGSAARSRSGATGRPSWKPEGQIKYVPSGEKERRVNQVAGADSKIRLRGCESAQCAGGPSVDHNRRVLSSPCETKSSDWRD